MNKKKRYYCAKWRLHSHVQQLDRDDTFDSKLPWRESINGPCSWGSNRPTHGETHCTYGWYKHITEDATSFYDKGTNRLGKGDKSGWVLREIPWGWLGCIWILWGPVAELGGGLGKLKEGFHGPNDTSPDGEKGFSLWCQSQRELSMTYLSLMMEKYFLGWPPLLRQRNACELRAQGN